MDRWLGMGYVDPEITWPMDRSDQAPFSMWNPCGSTSSAFLSIAFVAPESYLQLISDLLT